MVGLSQEEIGRGNKQRVLAAILGAGTISRTEVARRLGLNNASVSRITRDLIEARLIQELGESQPDGRRGPRTKQLAANQAGGYIIGIGINAYQQVVTLADLSNNRIAYWNANNENLTDARSFLELCASKAKEMVERHVAERERLFGVGITIAGSLDKSRGTVVSAPTLGWTEEVDAVEIIRKALGMPVVLETPSAAICRSEAVFGGARGLENIVAIYCSLGFGVGLQLNGEHFSGVGRFDGVLTEARIPTDSASSNLAPLSELNGGKSLLKRVVGATEYDQLNEREKGRRLRDIALAAQDGDIQIDEVMGEFGLRAANCFSLFLTIIQPQLLLLCGPLVQSESYFNAFRNQISNITANLHAPITIKRSTITPMSAARLLSLEENIIKAGLNLEILKKGNER